MGNVDVQSRHELHTRLDEVLGKKHAETMMSSVPPDWEQLATKQDLEQSRVLQKQDLTVVESNLRAEFYQALNAQTWRYLAGVAVISTFVSSVVTVAGNVFG